MRIAFGCFVLLTIIAVGCIHVVDPYKFVISGDASTRVKNHEAFMSTLKQLPKNDVAFVQDYDYDITDAEQTQGKKIPDRTVAQAIAYEKNKIEGWPDDITKIEQPPHITDNLKNTQRDIQQPTPQVSNQIAAMQKNVSLSVLNKQAIVNDSGQIQSGDQVVLTLGIQNKSAKDIQTIIGRVNVSAGRANGNVDMNINAKLPAGQTLGWQAIIKLSGPQDKPLLDADKNQLALDFEPQVIIFADGSRMDSR